VLVQVDVDADVGASSLAQPPPKQDTTVPIAASSNRARQAAMRRLPCRFELYVISARRGKGRERASERSSASGKKIHCGRRLASSPSKQRPRPGRRPHGVTGVGQAALAAQSDMLTICCADSTTKMFSFVDGVSFAVMRQRKLRSAFAFDAHFATAGFSRVPVDARDP